MIEATARLGGGEINPPALTVKRGNVADFWREVAANIPPGWALEKGRTDACRRLAAVTAASGYINKIAKFDSDALVLDWLRREQHPTLEAAWAACPRGDWMLWIAGCVVGPPGDPSRIPLVLAAADCAELVLHLVPEEDRGRPRHAIWTARRWCRGEATLEEVRRAAADLEGDRYRSSAFATPASCAAHTAIAAGTFGFGGASAAAGYAANAASDSPRRAADIVRRYYPTPPVLP